LRDPVRAVPGAVLTTDTGIGAVNDDAGQGILRVSFHRAPDQTGRLQAVVAAHGEVVALGIRKVAAFHFAHTPPIDCRGITILLVARNHAAFTSDALRHVEVKAVLLPGLEWPLRNQWLGSWLKLNQCMALGGRNDVSQFTPKQREIHCYAGFRVQIHFRCSRH
jgi:hypothetical protein